MQRQRLDGEQSVNDLLEDALSFGALVDTIVYHAVEALHRADSAAAQVALAEASHVGERRRQLENRASSLPAGRQAAGQEDRVIAAILHAAVELEQIAGQAAGIARVVTLNVNQSLLDPLSSLPRMTEKARAMLRRSLSALALGDARALRLAAAECFEMNPLRDQVELEAWFFLGRAAHDIEYANRLMWVHDSLLRIAERASGVCCRLAREGASDRQRTGGPVPTFSFDGPSAA